VQGKSLLPRLATLPEIGNREAVAMFAWYGLQGGVHYVDGFKIYPSGFDAYGNDIIGSHTKNHGANVVISLIDVWVMKDTAKNIAPAVWLPWLPVDHDPVPQKVLDALDGAYIPLTYAKWGHDKLKAAGVDNVYIPHGIEPSVFKIMPADSVQRFRKEVLFNPEHLTIMVAANKGYPDRKGFQFQVRAWAEFAKDKPGARLYIHTEPTSVHGGIDFAALLGDLGIKDKVVFPDRYHYFLGYPPEYMAMLYNAADVFLGASMSEGFGIPLIEAQACGTPVVTTDATSMPELVRWGSAVAPADRWWTPLNSWQYIPHAAGITEALNQLYAQWADNDRAKDQSSAELVSGMIHDEYSWDVIVRDHWAPLMTRLAAVMEPAPVAMEVAA
jgi:glycosyltransferase involved in cell wall biosynthesis